MLLFVLIGIRVVSVMALDFEIGNALEIEFDVWPHPPPHHRFMAIIPLIHA